MPGQPRLGRRTFLRLLSMSGLACALWPVVAQAQQPSLIARAIPSSGEAIPIIGLGSWITFNVGKDPVGRANAAAVIRHFFQAGGRLIDSSPMYGSAQEVIGACLEQLGKTSEVFAADKVWTWDGSQGREQIAASRRHWGIERFDLMQVHNLVAWQAHLETLFEMKAAGDIRYVGITTSHGRRHREFEQVMHSQPLDFIQLTYNIRDRRAEERLLPLARERGMAVIVNRPFGGGDLIDWAMRHPLPDWAVEIDCHNWAQFLLKFIVSHPAVTCAIPATTQVAHVRANMGAAQGLLPDAAMRKRMADYVEQL